MGRFGMWDPRKNDDYRFLDDVILEMFEMGGVGILTHKYLGPQANEGDATVSGGTKVTSIQDMLFLENRDRHYDPHVYELYGSYTMQDTEFNIMQFAMFTDADSFYLEFHLNETIRQLGRKLMSGDVFEMVHLRDDALLDEDSPAINKFYQVTDVNRASSGYSPTWFPHILRVKVKPLTDSQEFNDILNAPATDANGDVIPGLDLRSIISDYQGQIGVSEALTKAAEDAVPFRNFETIQFYVVPGDEFGKQYPWIFAGDGRPPNNAALAGSGNHFPQDPNDQDWFLRTDMDPHVLFQRQGKIWRRMEVDYRKKWQAAHRILESFINNTSMTTIDGETFAERQPLSKVILPKSDY